MNPSGGSEATGVVNCVVVGMDDVSADAFNPSPFCPCPLETPPTAWIPGQHGRLSVRPPSPQALLGSVSCAFLVLRAPISPNITSKLVEGQVALLGNHGAHLALFGKLRAQVAARLGTSAVPRRFVPVASLPETYSGKS